MNRTHLFLFELPDRIAGMLRWLPPTLARVTVGWVFLQTGWGKLNNLPQVVGFFESLGIPFPHLQAPFVAGTELVGGVLLLAGLLTRFAAVPLACTMVVAIATAQWPNIESLSGFLGLVETLYLVLFAWLAITGPGPLSLDALLEKSLRAREPVAGRVYGRAPAVGRP